MTFDLRRADIPNKKRHDEILHIFKYICKKYLNKTKLKYFNFNKTNNHIWINIGDIGIDPNYIIMYYNIKDLLTIVCPNHTQFVIDNPSDIIDIFKTCFFVNDSRFIYYKIIKKCRYYISATYHNTKISEKIAISRFLNSIKKNSQIESIDTTKVGNIIVQNNYDYDIKIKYYCGITITYSIDNVISSVIREINNLKSIIDTINNYEKIVV